MQRCTPSPNAACGFGNRSSTISSGSGNDAGSWLHIAYDRNMRSPAENSKPGDLAVLRDRATTALRGREVAQELLGGEVEVARVVDQPRPLVRVARRASRARRRAATSWCRTRRR